MRRAITALLLAGAALAADPDPATVAAAKELLDASNAAATHEVGLNGGFDAALGPARKQIPEAMREAFEAGITEVKAHMAKELPFSAVVDDQARSWAERFTADELRQLTAFYRSPLGAKLAQATPLLIADELGRGQRRMEELMPAIQRIMMQHMSQAQQARKAAALPAGVAVGKPFPEIAGAALDGKPVSLAALKGKVVLVDFWATWCGPCVQELPNLLAAYAKHHAAGFEVVAISLDEDRKDLDAGIAEHRIPWPQLFDGKGWEGDLPQRFGIKSIPATFLIGRDGTLVAVGPRGEGLEPAIAAALAK